MKCKLSSIEKKIISIYSLPGATRWAYPFLVEARQRGSLAVKTIITHTHTHTHDFRTFQHQDLDILDMGLGLGFRVKVRSGFRVRANFRVRVSFRVKVRLGLGFRVIHINDAGTFGSLS